MLCWEIKRFEKFLDAPLMQDSENDFILSASTQENMSSGFVNNKGADQPAHPGRLISAFVICFLENWKVSCLNLLLEKFQFSS